MTNSSILIGGIDGGGSNTRAVLVSPDGAVHGIGFAGSSTYRVVPPEVTQASIRTALEQAFASAGLKPRRLNALYIGLGGVINHYDKREMHELVGALQVVHEDHLAIDNDIKPALVGSLAGQAGLVLLVGTGSVCFGMDRTGHEWRAGGWSEVIDDPGSGYDLGRKALTATVRAYDGRIMPSPLTTHLYEKLELGDINEIVWRMASMTRRDIAALARIVMDFARKGDATALQILHSGTAELALMVDTVVRKLDFAGERVLLATTGGVFKAGDFFKNLLFPKILARQPTLTFTEPRFPPVVGSVILAGRILGLTLSLDHLASLGDPGKEI